MAIDVMLMLMVRFVALVVLLLKSLQAARPKGTKMKPMTKKKEEAG